MRTKWVDTTSDWDVMHISRQEQQVLEAAAHAEHKAALTAAAAAAKTARQDLRQMQSAADRMAWRTHRWRLASQRRTVLEVKQSTISLCTMIKQQSHAGCQ